MGKPEAYVEGYLVRRVKEAGGLCPKFTSPGTAGVPDRIVILDGRVVFVEAKAAGGRLRPIQVAQIAKLRDAGADVRVIDSRELVDDLIDELRIPH